MTYSGMAASREFSLSDAKEQCLFDFITIYVGKKTELAFALRSVCNTFAG